MMIMQNRCWHIMAIAVLISAVAMPGNAAKITDTEKMVDELLQQSEPLSSTEAQPQKLNKASQFIASKKYHQAIPLLEQLREASPQDKESCYFLSISHVGLQQWDQANSIIDECIAIDKTWVEALTLKATILSALQRYTEAQQHYSGIIALKPNSPGSYFQRAKFYYFYMRSDKRALQQSLSDIQQFKRLGGAEENTYALLGMVYVGLERFKEAKEQLVKAVNHQPGNYRILRHLVKIYHQQKHYQDANSVLEKAHRHLDKANAEQYSQYFLLRARNAILSEDSDRIDSYFTEALKIHPENNAARKEYIYWLDKQERLAETIDLSTQGLVYLPDDAYFTSFLAWAYADAGKDIEQATRWINKAKALEPHNVYLSDTYAWLAVRQGNYAEALERIAPSLPYIDQVPEIAYHVGVIHYHLGNEKKAVDYLTMSLQKNQPFNGKSQAKKLLSQLTKIAN